jgi:hypothetical protein
VGLGAAVSGSPRRDAPMLQELVGAEAVIGVMLVGHFLNAVAQKWGKGSGTPPNPRLADQVPCLIRLPPRVKLFNALVRARRGSIRRTGCGGAGDGHRRGRTERSSLHATRQDVGSSETGPRTAQ